MTNTFYIYLHRRLDTGDVFYVGKGTRSDSHQYQRALEVKRRSRLWRFVASKAGCSVELVADFFAESDAFTMERELIAFHGRRDTGRGSLVNMTDGGEGMAGHVPSDSTRAKRRASMVGREVPLDVRAKISASLSGARHPLFGTKRSEETRLRQSVAGKGIRLGGKSPVAKAVIDKATGRVFPSTRDAAQFAGLTMRNLSRQLAGERRNKTTMEYVR